MEGGDCPVWSRTICLGEKLQTREKNNSVNTDDCGCCAAKCRVGGGTPGQRKREDEPCLTSHAGRWSAPLTPPEQPSPRDVYIAS
jgi:hypothetical protein